MTDDLRSPLQHLIDQPDAERAKTVATLPFEQFARLYSAHDITAHAGQMPPPGDWTTWLILAGRGFGKTRAGAAWVDACARKVQGARIALVGATLGDARSVMVEGDARGAAHGQSHGAKQRVRRTSAAPVRADARCW